ncbi:MAG: exo 1,3/1,4-beta-D-glucan glucohydrolase [Gammaproteobacteria bacterium]|nr:exo 1,3/1,4-beta-D-glucan glucohydrolase [Gammaproteobacteria bacterium]MBT8151416.1 exo 1,3/1,4-beta-D-glucan glucohydrolase [Gammaproteobacteria bacterium]
MEKLVAKNNPINQSKAASARPAVMLAALALSALGGGCSNVVSPGGESTVPAYWHSELTAAIEPAKQAVYESRIKALLASMSLEQKVGQMVQAEIAHISPAQVAQYHIGSVLNGGGSFPSGNKYATINEWAALAEQFYLASRATKANGAPGIPLLWGTDAVHGHNNVLGATYFPHNIGLGATRNLNLLEQIAAATAREVTATNIKWVFAPTVAVAQDARWGRTYESFASDPELVEQIAQRYVRGLQGSSITKIKQQDRVIATAKHFIGDGATDLGVDQGDANISEKELFAIHAQGFLGALNAGAQTVMASFNSWQGNKVHGSSYLLTNILKDSLRFDGFVIGDWNGHAQVPGCSNTSCAAAINAGVDMIMVPEDWQAFIENTVAQVRDGTIAKSRIDDAVTRILRVKIRAGLFDQQNEVAPFATAKNIIGSEEHRALARQAVRESLVLLKNNDKILPIKPNAKVLVLGGAAHNIAQQSGGWTLTWQGDNNKNEDFPHGTSILDGIRNAVDSNGGRVVQSSLSKIREGIDFNPDVGIVVFGERPYAEGIGDKSDIAYRNYRSHELETLEILQSKGIPTVSVFISGRPLWVNAEINASNAFVAAWLPGTEGIGVADVLIGDRQGQPRYDFSGKLPFPWPAHPRQANATAMGEDPLFAFGYGLNYHNEHTLAALHVQPYPALKVVDTEKSLPLFVKKVISPWVMFVGDQQNWGVEISGSHGSTLNQQTVVVEPIDHVLQGDARKVRWTLGAPGQFFFQHNVPVDLNHLLERGAAMVFNLRVNTPPSSRVSLRIDCQYPCSGEIDITDSLESRPRGEWHRFAIDLACFAEAGAQFDRIDTPFLMFTEGFLEIGLADIEFEANARESADIFCGQQLTNL